MNAYYSNVNALGEDRDGLCESTTIMRDHANGGLLLDGSGEPLTLVGRSTIRGYPHFEGECLKYRGSNGFHYHVKPANA